MPIIIVDRIVKFKGFIQTSCSVLSHRCRFSTQSFYPLCNHTFHNLSTCKKPISEDVNKHDIVPNTDN